MDRGTAKDAAQLALFDEPPAAEGGALRHVLLGGEAVPFRFERRRRRTIGLRVNGEGLSVAAPLRAPWRDIESFIRDKERWILAKLEAWRAAGAPRVLYGEHGESLPLHGRETAITVTQGRRGVRLAGEPNALTLELSHPQPHRRGAILRMLGAWLRGRALDTLAPRAAHFAARLDLPPPPVALSNARTQWGVCRSDGSIRLNWRLVLLAPDLADYVVAHEVAHLVELNHSRRFWDLVEWLYPHWREAREGIEQAGPALPRL
jgi:predicted metal-dependent hydrolase